MSLTADQLQFLAAQGQVQQSGIQDNKSLLIETGNSKNFREICQQLKIGLEDANVINMGGKEYMAFSQAGLAKLQQAVASANAFEVLKKAVMLKLKVKREKTEGIREEKKEEEQEGKEWGKEESEDTLSGDNSQFFASTAESEVPAAAINSAASTLADNFSFVTSSETPVNFELMEPVLTGSDKLGKGTIAINKILQQHPASSVTLIKSNNEKYNKQQITNLDIDIERIELIQINNVAGIANSNITINQTSIHSSADLAAYTASVDLIKATGLESIYFSCDDGIDIETMAAVVEMLLNNGIKVDVPVENVAAIHSKLSTTALQQQFVDGYSTMRAQNRIASANNLAATSNSPMPVSSVATPAPTSDSMLTASSVVTETAAVVAQEEDRSSFVI